MVRIIIEGSPEEIVEKAQAIRDAVEVRLQAAYELIKSKDKKAVKKLKICGLDISIENPAGTYRKWKDKKTGVSGETLMLMDYGYIQGAAGADEGSYDVFVGPDPSAPLAFIFHQRRPDSGELWDEDKVMLGLTNIHQARAMFHAHYNDRKFEGSISVMPVEEFAERVLTQRDGMVKALRARGPKLVLKSLNPEIAADTSFIPDRAVSSGGGGANIIGHTPPMTTQETDVTQTKEALEDFAESKPVKPSTTLQAYDFRGLPVMNTVELTAPEMTDSTQAERANKNKTLILDQAVKLSQNPGAHWR